MFWVTTTLLPYPALQSRQKSGVIPGATLTPQHNIWTSSLHIEHHELPDWPELPNLHHQNRQESTTTINHKAFKLTNLVFNITNTVAEDLLFIGLPCSGTTFKNLRMKRVISLAPMAH